MNENDEDEDEEGKKKDRDDNNNKIMLVLSHKSVTFSSCAASLWSPTKKSEPRLQRPTERTQN